MDRRSFLAAAAAFGTSLAAGCTGGGSGEPTETRTPEPTATPVGTPTRTPTRTSTGTPTPTPTETPMETSTETPSATPTPTPTETQTPEPAVEGADVVVEAVGTAFDPIRAEVEAGTTVGWVNRDGIPHTVTAAQFHGKAASWEKDTQFGPSETAKHTFEEAGVYEYYCTIHGKGVMCGAVLVGDVSLEKSLPCEG